MSEPIRQDAEVELRNLFADITYAKVDLHMGRGTMDDVVKAERKYKQRRQEIIKSLRAERPWWRRWLP